MDTAELEQRGIKNLYDGAGWIRTSNGKFSLEKPTFDIVDIAHALSNNCRFNGHTSQFISVAEHCVNVSRIMRIIGGDPRAGLLHDATEAYLSDVPAPFKQFLPDWREVDDRLEYHLMDRYDVDIKTKEVKTADWYDLFIEALYLIPGEGCDFMDDGNKRERALSLQSMHSEIRPKCLPPGEAKQEFLTVAKMYGLA